MAAMAAATADAWGGYPDSGRWRTVIPRTEGLMYEACTIDQVGRLCEARARRARGGASNSESDSGSRSDSGTDGSETADLLGEPDSDCGAWGPDGEYEEGETDPTASTAGRVADEVPAEACANRRGGGFIAGLFGIFEVAVALLEGIR
ncbi:unnamed protein product, partial [Prorocentrum cordatum]